MYYAAMVDHSLINIKASSWRQAMRSASDGFIFAPVTASRLQTLATKFAR